MLSVEFVGDGTLLGEIGWDDSDDCGGVSGKILSVSASENAGEGERRGGKGGSWGGEGVRGGGGITSG